MTTANQLFRSIDPNPWKVIVLRNRYLLFFRPVFETIFPKLYVAIFTLLSMVPILIDLFEKEGSPVFASYGATTVFIGAAIMLFIIETAFYVSISIHRGFRTIHYSWINIIFWVTELTHHTMHIVTLIYTFRVALTKEPIPHSCVTLLQATMWFTLFLLISKISFWIYRGYSLKISCGRPEIEVVMHASAGKRLHDAIVEYHEVYRKALLLSEHRRILSGRSGAEMDAYLTAMNTTFIDHFRALLSRNPTETVDI